MQRLVPIAEEAGMSMATLALAWVLRRGEVASAITGASRPEQVHANAAASGVKLSATCWRQSTRPSATSRSPNPPSPLPPSPASSTADQAAVARSPPQPGRTGRESEGLSHDQQGPPVTSMPSLRRETVPPHQALSSSRVSRLMSAESVPGRPQGRPRATGPGRVSVAGGDRGGAVA
ncbi:aldo/keto reductase [Streptomyces violaceus]|uniref:aldo/keto reductase n=1 Tax=Streptomyces violaceus TaxID=1936 RepID=UPI0031EF9353